MKKTIIFCVLIVISGLLTALGPVYIFKGCAAGCCSSYPECYWLTKYMLGMGMIITALGLFYIVYNDVKIQMGMTIGLFFTSITALLAIYVLIGGCETKSMECNLVTIPFLTGLNILVVIASVIKFLSLRKS